MKKIILCLICSIAFPGSYGCVNAGDNQRASGSDTLRIEVEEKLLVPDGKYDEVWLFLKKRYLDTDENIKRMDAGLKISRSDEEFFDTYFD
ncbi:MAG: hypothetical protein PHS37_00330, partial [Candidatus Omnitrophica bacterium]|nr:hypothetical protein [Candidatus Omnitrophota bacterium]